MIHFIQIFQRIPKEFAARASAANLGRCDCVRHDNFMDLVTFWNCRCLLSDDSVNSHFLFNRFAEKSSAPSLCVWCHSPLAKSHCRRNTRNICQFRSEKQKTETDSEMPISEHHLFVVFKLRDEQDRAELINLSSIKLASAEEHMNSRDYVLCVVGDYNRRDGNKKNQTYRFLWHRIALP